MEILKENCYEIWIGKKEPVAWSISVTHIETIIFLSVELRGAERFTVINQKEDISR
jgi:hypothetical protein